MCGAATTSIENQTTVEGSASYVPPYSSHFLMCEATYEGTTLARGAIL